MKKIWFAGYDNAVALFIVCISVLLSCSGNLVNLTPDIIRDYGLDQLTLPNVQLYYRTITIHEDSKVTYDEPTIYRRLDSCGLLVSETRSPAYQQHLNKNDIVIIKNGTPCKINAILDSGRTLQADFGDLKLTFKLSYQSGYTFELASDTVEYQGKRFVRAPVPLMRTVGILSVNRKRLVELTENETRIKGKRVE